MVIVMMFHQKSTQNVGYLDSPYVSIPLLISIPCIQEYASDLWPSSKPHTLGPGKNHDRYAIRPCQKFPLHFFVGVLGIVL